MHNYTIEDYFRHENGSYDKSEFYKGQIFALPGVTGNHALINSNLSFEIQSCLNSNNKDCYVYLNDVKLYIPMCKISTYPDLMIVCDEPKYYKGQENYVITNPSLVVEILSKSTEKFDLETKLPCYLTVDTVKTVMLINQYKKQVEIYHKNKTSEPEIYTKGKFNVLGCEINVDDVYRKIKFVAEK